MNSQKCIPSKYIYCTVLMYLVRTILCYPIDKLNIDQPVLKDETHFPNGTIVGKYTYSDTEGNPIHVKYYADDSGYGVELKSLKVEPSSTDEPSWQPNNFDTFKPIETSLGLSSEFLNNTTEPNSNRKQYDYKNKEKKLKYKTGKSSDYDTLYQHDIQTPRQCEKDKVKVYLDKEKKIIRRALDNYQGNKNCDRF